MRGAGSWYNEGLVKQKLGEVLQVDAPLTFGTGSMVPRHLRRVVAPALPTETAGSSFEPCGKSVAAWRRYMYLHMYMCEPFISSLV